MIAGELVSAWRKRNKLSVRQLASRIKVDQSALWRFEQGKPINDANWVKIATWVLTDERQSKG